MHISRLVSVVVVAAAALTPIACGGSSSKGSAKGIEEQLGFDQAGLVVRQGRMEAAVRDCMKAQGFEYVPIDPSSQRAALTGSSRLSDQDFVRQFGYGVSTLWGRGGAQADPNQRVRSSLSPADQKAYERALGGDNPGATFQDALDTGDFTKLGGCRRNAADAVFGSSQVLTQVQNKLDQLDERILQDQRMVKAVEKWSTCMATAGYHYTETDAIDTDLMKRMEKIVGPLPGKFQTGPPPGEPARTYDQAALAQLQRDEVATARADTNCERKNITPVEDVVRPQYEAQFRKQNAALFTQVKPAR
jgi:hypothetical protein